MIRRLLSNRRLEAVLKPLLGLKLVDIPTQKQQHNIACKGLPRRFGWKEIIGRKTAAVKFISSDKVDRDQNDEED